VDALIATFQDMTFQLNIWKSRDGEEGRVCIAIPQMDIVTRMEDATHEGVLCSYESSDTLLKRLYDAGIEEVKRAEIQGAVEKSLIEPHTVFNVTEVPLNEEQLRSLGFVRFSSR
jgi:hypothetical protein